MPHEGWAVSVKTFLPALKSAATAALPNNRQLAAVAASLRDRCVATWSTIDNHTQRMVAPAVVTIAAFVFDTVFGLHFTRLGGGAADQLQLARRQIHFQLEGTPGIAPHVHAVELGSLPVFAAVDGDFHALHGFVATEGHAANDLRAGLDLGVGFGARAGDERFDVHVPHGWLIR